MTGVSVVELAATLCFGLAIFHTFFVKRFHYWAIEVVFGVWAVVFLFILAFSQGIEAAIRYLQARSFTEPAFVFVILIICSTRPVLTAAQKLIETISRLIPMKRPIAFYMIALTVGPALGSLITEPAAMTVVALILLDRFYKKGISERLMYSTIGLLFVNISIGGTLTPYAAPPILMVAQKWGWGLMHMLTHFGWKGLVASLISTSIVTYRFRTEIGRVKWEAKAKRGDSIVPAWVGVIHLLFLALIVAGSHYPAVFIGLFLIFLGFVSATGKHQSSLKLKEGLFVAIFLGGLVILGAPQRWWLEPILKNLEALPLYLSAATLTAITDNAALTYLGSQVPNLSEFSKYALVAGSVVGGGLTVIANAPNPAGYSILNSSFEDKGISPVLLFRSALLPTMIALISFWIL